MSGDTAAIHEAEKLLQEVASWSRQSLEELPKLYRAKAREYRRLVNSGETE